LAETRQGFRGNQLSPAAELLPAAELHRGVVSPAECLRLRVRPEFQAPPAVE
jgi:hypothetical protein